MNPTRMNGNAWIVAIRYAVVLWSISLTIEMKNTASNWAIRLASSISCAASCTVVAFCEEVRIMETFFWLSSRFIWWDIFGLKEKSLIATMNFRAPLLTSHSSSWNQEPFFFSPPDRGKWDEMIFLSKRYGNSFIYLPMMMYEWWPSYCIFGVVSYVSFCGEHSEIVLICKLCSELQQERTSVSKVCSFIEFLLRNISRI